MATNSPARATELSSRIGPLTRLFPFVQLDLPGALALADGRYVLREDEEERVLVVETHGAPPPPRRKRRKPRAAEPAAEPEPLPLARVTLVRAFAAFEEEGAAEAWLDRATAEEKTIDDLVAEALLAVNDALHAHAVASGDPHPQTLTAERTVATRLGYGSGQQVAVGESSAARDVDVRAGTSRRRQRDEELRPQERAAAVLGGRERLDACETLLLRARADLDANRPREAALQLRVGLEALLVELPNALDDPDHTADMATLESRRDEAIKLATSALSGDLDSDESARLTDLLSLCERVLRRRRILSS
ncbi:MAG TPA: hypothetical protein VF245_05105 [Solirubrobacterales bacterium]